jgi:hypothetical protein
VPRETHDEASRAAPPVDPRAAGDEWAERAQPREGDWPQLSALDLAVCLTAPLPGAGVQADGRGKAGPR